MENDQQEENNVAIEPEDEEAEEETLNFRRSFDMKKFRNKLQTGYFIFGNLKQQIILSIILSLKSIVSL